MPFEEIAEATGKSAAAVRQVAHRARQHVSARRPRMDVGRTEQRQVVDRFVAAVSTGDLQGLMDVLAPDAVLIADGGGVVQAIAAPVFGAKKIGNLFRNFPKVVPTGLLEPVLVNGAPGVQILIDGQVDTVIGFAFANGRISKILGVRNPHKLRRVGEPTALCR
jgi:RNA polymerase sigma-70 factor (ECF subfamily)